MPVTAGPMPTDAIGTRCNSGYSPNGGVMPIQLDGASADSSGQFSSPVNVNLVRGGSNFGTVANPIATNQLVGTPVYATATLSSGASANASLPAAVGKTTYINGFYVSVAHVPTTNVSGQVTVSLDGGVTTHMNFTIAVGTAYPGVVNMDFPDPIPATAANTAIKVTSPALSAAGIGSISVFGYQL